MAFVHLHNHSEYSLLDGTVRLKDLIAKTVEQGSPAVALTDHGYMFGVPDFVRACQYDEQAKVYKINPIVGCEVYFTDDDTLSREQKPVLYHMILLAKNEGGYKDLIKLCSIAATDNFYYKPRVSLELLQQATANHGLIGTSACLAGIIPRLISRDNADKADEWTKQFISCFAPGDFYMELQNQELITEEGMTQTELNSALQAMAVANGIKTVGTNDIHYLTREDAKTQDLALCVGTNAKVDEEARMRFSSDQFYMKSEDEMRTALVGFEQAIDNTIEVAEKCHVLLENKIVLPVVPLPAGKSAASELLAQAEAGCKERYCNPLPAKIAARLKHEYSIIARAEADFSAYFLVVAEFVNWARQNGIAVGPGRGSAAGSIVSYALGITDVDPLEHGLIFERFLNPERIEMPDIDIDFDDTRRAEVIEHLRELYGSDHVAHVITFGKMKAKNAINDAARVLDLPIWQAQKLSNMVPNAPGVTLHDVLYKSDDPERRQNYNPELSAEMEASADSAMIMEAALRLEGYLRGEGVHASAVLITPEAVTDYIPVKLDKKEKSQKIVTQYDGNSIAKLNLLKMDFLGLRNLSTMQTAQEYIKQSTGKDFDVRQIDFTDPKIFAMLASGETAGVFQVESSGMTQLLKQMQVDCFSDIAVVVALFRPGPIESGYMATFVKRKTGKEPVEYYDERLKPILEETYGTIVYQEQVMQISMAMCGFTVGESDKLRKAMGKKDVEIMRTDKTWSHERPNNAETMQEAWLNGAVKNGYSPQIAQKIWDEVLNFAKYAFNKSHATSYAYITMYTAALKCYYPKEYMAALLSSLLDKHDKLAAYIIETKQMGIDVLPPDINTSNMGFTVLRDKKGGIGFGLAGIKEVADKAVSGIMLEREQNGPFLSLHDFVMRVPNTVANKRPLEALIKAGAFDSLGYGRLEMMDFITNDGILETATAHHSEVASGQDNLFDVFDVDPELSVKLEAPPATGKEWPKAQKLAYEKEVLGLYVSDHPLNPYLAGLRAYSTHAISDLVSTGDDEQADIELTALSGEVQATAAQNGQIVKTGGLIQSMQALSTKRGEPMVKFRIEDLSSSIDCIVFPKNYQNILKKLGNDFKVDAVVNLVGKYESTDRGDQILVHDVGLPTEDKSGVFTFADLEAEKPRREVPQWQKDKWAEQSQQKDQEIAKMSTYEVSTSAGAPASSVDTAVDTTVEVAAGSASAKQYLLLTVERADFNSDKSSALKLIISSSAGSDVLGLQINEEGVEVSKHRISDQVNAGDENLQLQIEQLFSTGCLKRVK